jgi:hypothetical protein
MCHSFRNSLFLRGIMRSMISWMQGVLLFGFPKNEVKAVQSWLSGAGIKVMSGDGLLNRASSVLDAVALLENSELKLLTDSAEDVYTGFSRVVLFSGFPGSVIEGLVDVWREELSTLCSLHHDQTVVALMFITVDICFCR